MIKRLIIMLVLVGVVFGGLFGFNAFKQKKIAEYMADMKPDPAHVATAKAFSQTWHQEITAVGSVTPVDSVDLAAEVSGTITAIHFDSGETVFAGDLLLELDSSTELASLKSAKATAELAKINFARQEELRDRSVNTQADFDQAKATRDQALAAVELAEAALDKKQIRAPFNGVLGLREISVGQFLNAGASIVYIQSNDPVYVDFSLPQSQFQMIKRNYQVVATVEGDAGKTFTGTIQSMTPNLEENTRQARVRAVFDNPDALLTPGMFANVTVELPASDELIILPNAAITYNPYGNAVYVVKKDNTVSQRFVKTGLTRGDLVVIEDGIEVGEEVVTAGQLKLRNGSEIIIDNERTPNAEERPNPEES